MSVPSNMVDDPMEEDELLSSMSVPELCRNFSLEWSQLTTDLLMSEANTKQAKFFINVLAEPVEVACSTGDQTCISMSNEIGQWHAAYEYDGQVREITYRSICHSPMCPPDTAMTELQHAVLSPDKKVLVLEKVVQAHDVHFGSYFEVHSRWQ